MLTGILAGRLARSPGVACTGASTAQGLTGMSMIVRRATQIGTQSGLIRRRLGAVITRVFVVQSQSPSIV